MIGRTEILKRCERGFTLMESLLVVGLTTLIAVGIVVGFMEGLDTLHTLTDSQNVEFGHQKVMDYFISDVHSATWFYNGSTHDEDGTDILNETANTYYLIMGYRGPNGVDYWIRYKVKPGVFTGETYLMRTVVTSTGEDEGTTFVATGISNLEFTYYDENGEWTDQLPDVRKVQMTLALTSGGATLNRDYSVSMMNPNMGVMEPPGDFNDVESDGAIK